MIFVSLWSNLRVYFSPQISNISVKYFVVNIFLESSNQIWLVLEESNPLVKKMLLSLFKKDFLYYSLANYFIDKGVQQPVSRVGWVINRTRTDQPAARKSLRTIYYLQMCSVVEKWRRNLQDGLGIARTGLCTLSGWKMGSDLPFPACPPISSLFCPSLLWMFQKNHPSGTNPSSPGRVGWVQFFLWKINLEWP